MCLYARQALPGRAEKLREAEKGSVIPMRFSDWLILVVGGVLAVVLLVAVCWLADWLLKMLLAVFA